MTNFTEFTSYSPNYVPAKIEFLEWLQERARERGYDPKLDRNNQILFERSFTVIRTRGSLRQSSPFKFKVNDEVNTELPNFENAYSVVLDLHSATEFDPDIDDFYPMPLVYYQTRTNEDKNGDYPISIYLGKPRLERCRNSVDVLFLQRVMREQGLTKAMYVIKCRIRHVTSIKSFEISLKKAKNRSLLGYRFPDSLDVLVEFRVFCILDSMCSSS